MEQTARVGNDLVSVEWSQGRWGIAWPTAAGAAVREIVTTVVVDGTATTVSAAGAATRRGSVLRVTEPRPGLELTVATRLVPGQSSVVFGLSARNTGDRSISLGEVATVHTPETRIGPAGDAEPVVYVDSGGQGGTHMARLGAGQRTAGICAAYSPGADLSLVCAFVSFEHDNAVTLAPRAGALELRAFSTTAVTLAPGDEHRWDTVLVDCRRSPFEALEEYASVVRDTVRPPIPATMPMGWLSWYAYRLTMTEDIVLQNAAVVGRHFQKYGVTLIHPDHGWQYKDICGHWVPNEKFPHGIEWLRAELEKQGMSLALWVAPSVVSEFAPLAQEHPDALVTDAAGKPVVIGEKWYWPPHGKTYNVDPLTPGGARFLADFGALMRSYGTVYVKTDFIGSWGGAPRLRHGMRLLRQALGPEIVIRPCSTALNTQLGLCNEIGIARDIGNAASNWQTMHFEMLELGSKWFMHNKFWHNNPDVLIVGDAHETLGEARGRVTLLALTGGVVFLGDRMPELEKQPERLKLCSLVLPSSGQPARPIDLFRAVEKERDYPRLWHLHAVRPWGQWEVLGVFNWSATPLAEAISRRDLGLAAGEYLVWDFWEQQLLGPLGADLQVAVEPGNVRCLRLMARPEHPAVLATDMHVTQGLVELDRVAWNPRTLELSGQARRAPGEQGAVFIYVPPGYALRPGSPATTLSPDCVRLPVDFPTATAAWTVGFARR